MKTKTKKQIKLTEIASDILAMLMIMFFLTVILFYIDNSMYNGIKKALFITFTIMLIKVFVIREWKNLPSFRYRILVEDGKHGKYYISQRRIFFFFWEKLASCESKKEAKEKIQAQKNAWKKIKFFKIEEIKIIYPN